MSYVEFSWLESHENLKGALQDLLGCSGQLLKKNFSSKELQYPIREKTTSKIPLNVANNKRINPTYDGPSAKILAIRKDYIVVHKPANVHSHPHEYSDTNTVLNFLSQESMDECLSVNKENYDRGLIYRLDYETSGILIVARTDEFYSRMRQDFNSEFKSKFYLAIVEGNFNKEGFHTHSFRASGDKGSKQKVCDTFSSQESIGNLEVKSVQFLNGKSLLLVNLHHGLRHQIRAQLAHLGYPILGDTLYGGKEAKRLFLHAYRYEFSSIEEDLNAELFESFFDLNSCFKMCHDMFRFFKSR